MRNGKLLLLCMLIKLNSSVLTAADYLATHAYMTGRQVKEAGIFEDRHRVEEMIGHLRNYKHNRGIYEQLDKFVFEYPQEKSGDHLNRLRTGMAVEVMNILMIVCFILRLRREGERQIYPCWR